jgi:lipoprotein NlpD
VLAACQSEQGQSFVGHPNQNQCDSGQATSKALARALLLMLVILVVATLSGCGSHPVRKPASYTVKPGDTIYSISWRHGVDYHDLARFNHIGRDYHISVGQVLQLPVAGVAATKTASTSKTVPTTRAAPVINSHIRWQWPVRSTQYAATTRPNGGKGLMINGSAGQDIFAAASGRVVYAGSGLLGYGQLLILKHDEAFLSAYGHTQTLYVHEGDSVSGGQKIATMGKGPNGTPQLYFEIRSNGSPLSPLSLLPQQ